jgi:hypothetical protein
VILGFCIFESKFSLIIHIFSFLDFKILLCWECCILSFGWFTSVFVGQVDMTHEDRIVAKLRRTKFRCRAIAQKQEYIVFLFIVVFKLSPCCRYGIFSSGYFPGFWILKADVSEHSCRLHLHRWVGVKMELTECSETSAFNIQKPGIYPEDNIPYFCLSHQNLDHSCIKFSRV